MEKEKTLMVKKIVVGPLEVNCFIVAEAAGREAIVIDPGDEPDMILDFIREEKLHVRHLVCTHGHFDHVGALPELKAAIKKAEVVIHRDEVPVYERAADLAKHWGFQLDPLPRPDRLVSEGDTVTIGKISLRVLHTPGHSPGGISLLADGVVFTGDALFAGSVGRTDLPGGNHPVLLKSLARLATLPGETVVHPGHGESTTIAREKRSNPYLAGLPQ